MPSEPTHAELIDAIDVWKVEAYIVIGQLLGALNAINSPEGLRALDYFSSKDLVPSGDIIPYDAPNAPKDTE